MPELIVKYPDRAPDRFPLGRLRITLGRSARNDLCIPDPFASRVHAEVRREGEEYFLQDLGSANGTLYNGGTVEGAVPLTAGGRIQIGETEIVFDDGSYHSSMGATMITDNSSTSLPEATIALASGDRTTSGLLEAIEGARTSKPEISAARVARESVVRIPSADNALSAAGALASSAGGPLAFRNSVQDSREGPWEVMTPRSSCPGGE